MTKSKETATPATGIKRTEKTRSAIWNHFTKIGNGQQSKCNYCCKVFASDSSKSGTSSMWKHIDFCNAYKSVQFDEKQKTLTRQKNAGDNGEGPVFNLTSTIFNKDECRRSLIRMIIIDELSFSFVDGEGFKDFVKTLCPRFEVPSRRTVVRDVLYLYNETKESLKKKLIQNRQRVSLTTDCWTSIQNINYMVITAHFIDKNWKLHKRILSFSVVPNHKGETIGKLVENCLLDWGIEHVASITVDNANANDTAVIYVKNKLKNWKVDSLILGGAYLHVRCSAHIVNLIVNEGLKEFNPCISSIRNAVKYFRSSPSRYMKFKSCTEREKIVCKKLACLDVPTRWNSTFLMLDSALHFEKAFERMEEEDGLYYKYFTERESGQEREGPPTSVDWEKARKFSKFLRTFYDVTLKFSSSLNVTSNLYFKEICNIEHALETLGNKDDIMLSNMARNMKVKFDKYWGTVEKMNKILILAIILDLRYKLEYVSYCASILYDVNKVNTIKTEVTKLMYDVFMSTRGGMALRMELVLVVTMID